MTWPIKYVQVILILLFYIFSHLPPITNPTLLHLHHLCWPPSKLIHELIWVFHSSNHKMHFLYPKPQNIWYHLALWYVSSKKSRSAFLPTVSLPFARQYLSDTPQLHNPQDALTVNNRKASSFGYPLLWFYTFPCHSGLKVMHSVYLEQRINVNHMSHLRAELTKL